MSHLHIPDGVLPLWLWASGWLLTLVAITVASKIAERAEVRRKIPLLAVVSALMIVAMSSEIVPLAYHINLTVIAGVLLGPVLSVIAAFIVEVVLAMLGHGGVTVLGLNTLIVATEMIAGALLFRLLVRVLSRRRLRAAAFIATVVTLAISTTLLVLIVAIGGAAATERETGALDPGTLSFANPLSEGVFSAGLFSGGETAPAVPPEEAQTLSVKRFALVVYLLGPFGWVLEGLITAWVLGYVVRVRPGLVWSGVFAERTPRITGDEAGRR